MNDEDESIGWTANEAWAKYNPEWLLEKVDLGNSNTMPAFNIDEMRQAYTAGFKAGVTYFVTKEIPEVNK